MHPAAGLGLRCHGVRARARNPPHPGGVQVLGWVLFLFLLYIINTYGAMYIYWAIPGNPPNSGGEVQVREGLLLVVTARIFSDLQVYNMHALCDRVHAWVRATLLADSWRSHTGGLLISHTKYGYWYMHWYVALYVDEEGECVRAHYMNFWYVDLYVGGDWGGGGGACSCWHLSAR